jgi:hypothetical protein
MSLSDAEAAIVIARSRRRRGDLRRAQRVAVLG